MDLDSETLPNDVMFEILTFVNLDDLATWRQVSREFFEMTKETTFKTQHCLKTKTASGYLIKCSQYNKPYDSSNYSFISEYPVKCPIDSLPIMKRYMNIEAVSQCRGMICCIEMKVGKERYYICKPATGQCKAIPNPKLRFRTVATAMVANSSGPVDFKIIRFSKPYKTDGIICEIFDSRIWAWRMSKDIKKHMYFPGEGFGRNTRAIFVNGAIHWLIFDNVEMKAYIFAFDIDKETWELIQVPPRNMDFESMLCSKIAACDGKLCYVNMEDGKEPTIWTLERDNGNTWWNNPLHNLKEPGNLKNGWLEFFMEFIYCPHFFTKTWKNFWEKRLASIGLKQVYNGEVFKIDSDFNFCECLA